MRVFPPPARLALTAVAAAAVLSNAHAAPTLTNGGFESGLAGWSVVNQLGSGGTFVSQTGTTSPVNFDPVPAPPQGTRAAMSDGDGPGTHLLYQDFVASAGPASLSFSLFIGNRADRFATPATLDFSTPALNQQVRVDIIRASADPFSVLAADILQTIYTSAVGDTLVTGYNTITADVTSLMSTFNGQTLRLRFAEVDNVAQMQMGVDNVAFGATVAEPGSLLLAAAALASLAGLQRRQGRLAQRT